MNVMEGRNHAQRLQLPQRPEPTAYAARDVEPPALERLEQVKIPE